jgi:hypothetical protein
MSFIDSLLPAAVLYLASCSILPGARGYHTPQEALQNASALDGRIITVRGKVEVVSSSCTWEACPPENPYCNACYRQLGFRADENHPMYLTGEGFGCVTGSCQTECPSVDTSHTDEVTGKLAANGVYTVESEIIRWRVEG